MSGSGGAGGYDYQADVNAYVATYILCGQPLGWFDDFNDTPTAVLSETDGPGDDLGIETGANIKIEVQSKHGLTRGEKFNDAVRGLINGLIRDPALRCVLLVDSTTSGTIRNEFRDDVRRLADGRTDNLREITKSVLALFTPGENVDSSVFCRFRVIVRDLADGEEGRASCTALLRQVVADSIQMGTAWDVLGKDGHRQMSRRGRRDAAAFSRLLGARVALKQNASNFAVAAEAYRSWQIKVFGQFFVPGVGVTLPIDRAWIGLRILGDELSKTRPNKSLARMVQAYHEWERLADDFTRVERREAEYLLAFDDRVVVLGGPGSGKSTLADRIAWRAAREGQRVLKVRLKTVAAGMREGQGFDQALIAAAADTSGLPIKTAEQILISPDVLVADGLDETDPARADVARALVSWCAGHPSCQVCVLTRPAGHEPGLLPGFRHVELLPLDSMAIEKHSLVLFRESLSEEAALLCWCDFLSLVRDAKSKHRVASLAARNPLLLGFLVRLTIDGVAVGENRAALYEQVVRLVQTNKVGDREVGPEVDEVVAYRVVDLLGWLVTRRPEIPRSAAVQEIGGDLAVQLKLPHLRASQEAERALRHWEARRLIERLTAGHQEALVFVHPSLGEFGAARYAASLTDAELDSWVKEAQTEPRWRQVVLLAAGLGQAERIVQGLLSFDRLEDPNSTEVILAAAALEEAQLNNPALTTTVVDRLSARLTSPIPLVAVEAALAMRPLAAYIPDKIGAISASLIDHAQAWTHLAGMALALAAGPEFVGIDRVRSFLETFESAPRFLLRNRAKLQQSLPEEASELKDDAVKNALERLFQELPPAEAASMAEALGMSGKTTRRIEEIVRQVLEAHGQQEVSERIRKRWSLAPEAADWLISPERSRGATLAFLDAVQRATQYPQRPVTSTNNRPLVNLAAVRDAMGIMEVPLGDWYVLGQRTAEDVVAEAAHAAIVALGLDPRVVGEEVNQALGYIDEDSSLYRVLPSVSTKPDWSRCVNAGLDLSLLGQGLFHPCLAIIWSSACVLSQEGWGSEVRELVDKALTNGGEKTLQITAQLVEPVWGLEAITILLRRFSQPLTPGCEHLYPPLVMLARAADHGSVRVAILGGIEHQNPAIAKGAATSVLLKPDLFEGKDVGRIEQLLTHWTRRGTWCNRCRKAVLGSSCPSCNVVPPSPRAALVRILTILKALSHERLISLCRDDCSDVAEAARKGLVEIASSDGEKFRQLLDGIALEEVPIQVLEELLALPVDSLNPHAGAIAALAQSPSVPVRLSLLRSLPSGWASHALAHDILNAGLCDPDPAVRTQATRSLRSVSR